MSVEVVLKGVLGKRFGRFWNLQVTSAPEALSVINANRPGLFDWIRKNAAVYDRYRVTVTYQNGRQEDISEQEYQLQRGHIKQIVFSPILEGAGRGVGQIIVGALMIAAGMVINIGSGGTGTPLGNALIAAGVSTIIGGVIQMLTPQPKLNRDESSGSDGGKRASSYFDGPANTTRQGNPVPLCYGRILAGSQAVSAKLDIQQVAK